MGIVAKKIGGQFVVVCPYCNKKHTHPEAGRVLSQCSVKMPMNNSYVISEVIDG